MSNIIERLDSDRKILAGLGCTCDNGVGWTCEVCHDSMLLGDAKREIEKLQKRVGDFEFNEWAEKHYPGPKPVDFSDSKFDWLRESYKRELKEIEQGVCLSCHGRGTVDDGKAVSHDMTCPTCNGSGRAKLGN